MEGSLTQHFNWLSSRAGTAGSQTVRHAFRGFKRSPVVTASLVDPSALYTLSTSAADAGGSSMLALLAGSALVAGLLYHTYQVKAHRQTDLVSAGGSATSYGSPNNVVRQEAKHVSAGAPANVVAAPAEGVTAPGAASAVSIAPSALLGQTEEPKTVPDTRLPTGEWIAAWRAALEASTSQRSNGKAEAEVPVLHHAHRTESPASDSVSSSLPVDATVTAAEDQAAPTTVALTEAVHETPIALPEMPIAAPGTPIAAPETPIAAPQSAPRALPAQAQTSGPAYQARLAEIQASSLGDVRRRVVSIGEAYQSKVGELWSSYAKRQAEASPPATPAAAAVRAPAEETITLDVPVQAQRGVQRGVQLVPAVQRWVVGALHELGLRLRAVLDRLAALQAGLTHDASGRELGFIQALRAALQQLLRGPPPSKGGQRQALGA